MWYINQNWKLYYLQHCIERFYLSLHGVCLPCLPMLTVGWVGTWSCMRQPLNGNDGRTCGQLESKVGVSLWMVVGNHQRSTWNVMLWFKRKVISVYKSHLHTIFSYLVMPMSKVQVYIYIHTYMYIQCWSRLLFLSFLLFSFLCF